MNIGKLHFNGSTKYRGPTKRYGVFTHPNGIDFRAGSLFFAIWWV